MNLQSMLVRHNYMLSVATLDVSGRKGTITIHQTTSQARTDTASVIVKLDGEKAVKQKINSKVEWEGITDYLSEFYINAEFIQAWSV